MRTSRMGSAFPASILLLAGLLALALVPPVRAAQPALKAVNGQWRLTGTPLEFAWDTQTGALLEVRLASHNLPVLVNAQKPFDLHTDAGWIGGTRAVRGRKVGALVLDGVWRFHLPDGKSRTIRVPGAWEKQGVTAAPPNTPNADWLPYNGDAWYRRTFKLPPTLGKQDLILVIEQVDDFDWVSINGRAVGHTGEETAEWWAALRRYRVPAALLKPENNTIEIKVYDRGGEGGILGSVLLMTPAQEKEWRTPPIRLERARLESIDAAAGSVLLEYAGNGWTVRERWRVDRNRPFASRTVELTAGPAAGTPKFDQLYLFLGNLAPALNKAVITAPYVWPPSQPTVAEFAEKGNIALSCSTAVTGMTVTPLADDSSLVLGQYWEKDWNLWMADAWKGHVRLRTKYLCRGRVRPGLKIPAGGQFISVVRGGAAAGLREIGAAWERLGFHRPPMPDWDRGLALYSLSAKGSMGSYTRDLLSPGGKPSGLRNFQRLQLPGVERLGVTAIWFLPLWPRGYGVSDYWSIDPATGTEDDLRAVVKDAHRAGVRVLGDLIPHGPHASSGLGREHPEYVARHEDGSFISCWGCLACDYAHPGWQQYMARVAAHWVKTCDLDGWRVDVAGAGRANWKSVDDFLPSWSEQWGGLRMMAASRQAVEAVKPGCLFLGECSNPPMLGQAQCIYDWPAQRVFFDVLEQDPTTWVRNCRAWLERQRLALPGDAARGLMHFTENHDEVHSEWQLGPDMARAVWALCVFAEGFPLVYHEQEVGFEDFWAEALKTRALLPELRAGAADYAGVEASAPRVFAFARTAPAGATLIAINFSRREQRTRLTWHTVPSEQLCAREFPGDRNVPVESAGKELAVTVALPPWAWRAVVLRSDRAALAAVHSPVPLEPAPVRSSQQPAPVDVAVQLELTGPDGKSRTVDLGTASSSVDQAAGRLKRARIRVGEVDVLCRAGLIEGIQVEGKSLVRGMTLREGAQRVFSGPLTVLSTLRDGADSADIARFDPGPWSVKRLTDGRVELRSTFTSTAATFSSVYHVGRDAGIDVDLRLIPHGATGPVLGRLFAAFCAPVIAPGAPPVQRWHVRTVEGAVGGPFTIRHPTPAELPGRFWHPIQRLWEHSLLPLALEQPAIEWQANGHRLWIECVEYPGPKQLDNVYLREYAPDGKPGLTAVFAGLDARRSGEFSPEHPFRVHVRLNVDREPVSHRIILPVRFQTEGANWIIENRYYKVRIRRSRGGTLRTLQIAGKTRPVLTDDRTYSDYGIIGVRRDPLGNEYKAAATNDNDFEPDCWIEPGPAQFRLRFWGKMRQRGRERDRTAPPIEYETVWSFTTGPAIDVRQRTRVMAPPRPKVKAFLARVLSCDGLESWETRTPGGLTQTGGPVRDASGRVWVFGALGKVNPILLLRSSAGSVRIEKIEPWGAAPQNVFLTHGSGSGRYAFFLAMLDGKELDLDARWRGFSYRINTQPSESVPPGGR